MRCSECNVLTNNKSNPKTICCFELAFVKMLDCKFRAIVSKSIAVFVRIVFNEHFLLLCQCALLNLLCGLACIKAFLECVTIFVLGIRPPYVNLCRRIYNYSF